MPRDPAQRNEWLLTAGPFLWLFVLFLVPTLAVVAGSFRESNPYGGFGDGWSLDAWRAIADPNYPAILWRTVWLSVVATVICLGVSLPVAFLMGRTSPRVRAILLLLVVVPFWTNFLIRVFAWKVMLHPEGVLRRTLVSLNVLDERTLLLYNPWAVLLVMVYTYLPFAILPLYAAAEKFDFGLLDAARDLGASAWRGFWLVFIPGVRGGLNAALAMVLIPALGSYVIPDIVGGPNGEMLGNKIQQRVFVDRNLPHASALAVVLILLVALPALAAYVLPRLRRRPDAEEPARRGGDSR